MWQGWPEPNFRSKSPDRALTESLDVENFRTTAPCDKKTRVCFGRLRTRKDTKHGVEDLIYLYPRSGHVIPRAYDPVRIDTTKALS